MKIRVFTWHVATDLLPTKKNKWRRTLETDDRCTICGHEYEDSHHVVVRCTKAIAIRHAMRKYWRLPDEHLFNYSGKEWLRILLG
jgi:hypothetical protein